MSVYLSPGVYSKEKDISEIVPNIATTIGALVGYSAKGDTDDVKLITNSQQFIDEYGKPDNSSGNYFHYTALAFLEQGNRLYCYRVQDSAKYGGVIIGTTGNSAEAFSDTSSVYEYITGSGYSGSLYGLGNENNALFSITGKDPGVWNNKIKITITDLKKVSKVWDFDTDDWADAKASQLEDDSELPDVDQYTFVIKVYYENEDGDFVEVESWKVSRKHKIDGYGKNLYLEDKINGYSDYIKVSDSEIADTSMPDGLDTKTQLGDGSDGTAYSSLSSSVFTTGWDEFSNPDDIDVRLLLNGGEASDAVQTKMKSIAESRADCVAIFDMPSSKESGDVDDQITWRQVTQNINSNYCALYSPWVTINDPYNDVVLDVPPSGYVGAQIAYNDYVAQPWFAPAGYNRGRLNILGLSKVFTLGERDSLYEAGINPLQTFRGDGDVIWGQKTLQSKASALDRINVRRLLIVIEKAMSITLRQYTFEPNNEITRFRVVATLVEYLDMLSAQGAFQTEAGDKGYTVICNTTNNTPAIIDRNELHVDVFVKPSRAAEFIQLQTIVTNSGASFDELVSKGVMF